MPATKVSEISKPSSWPGALLGRFTVLLLVPWWAVACDSPTDTDPTVPSALEIAAQDEEAETASSVELAVSVTNAAGDPVSGVETDWEILSGGGELSSEKALTDADGVAAVTWTVGTEAGEGRVQAEIEGLSPVTFTVEIRPGSATTVTLADSSLLLEALGEEVALEAVAEDEHGNPVEADFTWVSSDDAVVEVSDEGVLTSEGPGTATITVEADGAFDSVDVEVVQAVASIEIDPEEHVFTAVRHNRTFEATARDANGFVIPLGGAGFAWESSDDDVAEVALDGYVTAEGAGEATITATLDEVTGEALAAVRQVADSVEIDPISQNVPHAGEDASFQPKAWDENGYPIPLARSDWEWESSDEDVAVIAGPGVVLSTGLGESTISAERDDLVVTALFTVGMHEWTEHDNGMEEQPTRALYGVHMVEDRAWAVGHGVRFNPDFNSTVLRKIGAGDWTELNTDLDWNLNDVHFVTTGSGWVVGGPEIARTFDGGETWTVQHTSEILYAIHAVDSHTAWAVGMFGTIVHTSDGHEWHRQETPVSDFLNDVFFVDDKIGWAVGSNNVMLHTTDGGLNWEDRTLHSESIGEISAVHFVDANIGWAVGQPGVFHTTDGGDTWDNEWQLGRPFDVFFIEPEIGWIVGAQGRIWFTNDAGRTWGEQDSGSSSVLRAVYFTDPGNGIAVGSGGTIVSH